MGQLYQVFYYKFARTWLKEYTEAVINNLLNAPEKNIRDYDKDEIEKISENL
jgi:hypothetical protein